MIPLFLFPFEAHNSKQRMIGEGIVGMFWQNQCRSSRLTPFLRGWTKPESAQAYTSDCYTSTHTDTLWHMYKHKFTTINHLSSVPFTQLESISLVETKEENVPTVGMGKIHLWWWLHTLLYTQCSLILTLRFSREKTHLAESDGETSDSEAADNRRRIHWPRWGFNIFSLSVGCSCTSCGIFLHFLCSCTSCGIFLYFLWDVLTLPALYSYTSCEPFLHFPWAILTLPVRCSYTSCEPFLHFLWDVLTLPVGCSYTSSGEFLNFLWDVFALSMVCSFTSCGAFLHFLR